MDDQQQTTGGSWQEALSATLVQRLMRPLQPGVIALARARAILARAQNVGSSQLAERLLQRARPAEGGAGGALPLVHALPAPERTLPPAGKAPVLRPVVQAVTIQRGAAAPPLPEPAPRALPKVMAPARAVAPAAVGATAAGRGAAPAGPGAAPPTAGAGDSLPAGELVANAGDPQPAAVTGGAAHPVATPLLSPVSLPEASAPAVDEPAAPVTFILPPGRRLQRAPAEAGRRLADEPAQQRPTATSPPAPSALPPVVPVAPGHAGAEGAPAQLQRMPGHGGQPRPPLAPGPEPGADGSGADVAPRLAPDVAAGRMPPAPGVAPHPPVVALPVDAVSAPGPARPTVRPLSGTPADAALAQRSSAERSPAVTSPAAPPPVRPLVVTAPPPAAPPPSRPPVVTAPPPAAPEPLARPLVVPSSPAGSQSLPIARRPAPAGAVPAGAAAVRGATPSGVMLVQPQIASEPPPAAEPPPTQASEPQGGDGVDRIADHVYELLVRRLAAERERRGF